MQQRRNVTDFERTFGGVGEFLRSVGKPGPPNPLRRPGGGKGDGEFGRFRSAGGDLNLLVRAVGPRLVIQFQLHDDAARVLALVVNHGAREKLIADMGKLRQRRLDQQRLAHLEGRLPRAETAVQCATAMMR